MNNEDKREYPEFEGTYIKVKHTKRVCDVFVAVCSWNDGLTLVLVRNKEHKIVCLNRREQAKNEKPEQYDKEFSAVLEGVRKGYIDLEELRRKSFRPALSHAGVTMNCAYE